MLVTGASGLLGNRIVELAKKDYFVIPVHHTRPLQLSSSRLDITSSIEVSDFFDDFKPDVVVHAASETNVDKCEKEKEPAWRINVEGTRNVARACHKIGAKLVYISTDFVFDGERGNYEEQDNPNPVNYYGVTKLEGENQVAKHCENYLILRTSVLYGWHPWKLNFATWVISQLRQDRQILVVRDHFNKPTFANDMAEMTLKAEKEGLHGLYHTTGSERISRFEFAQRIAEVFELTRSLVKPTKMSDLAAWIAARPRDSSLCTEKVQKHLRRKPLSVTEGLRRMKEEE